jgi:CDP-ribitol ribitolphosphotransferase
MNFFKKLLFFALRKSIPLLIIPEKKIIFISEGNSGCSANSLYKYFIKNYKHILVEKSQFNLNPEKLSIFKYLSQLIYLSKGKVLVTTHGPVSLPNRIELNSWHSPLFKSVINMENPTNSTKLKTNWRKVNIILSYSQLYTSLMVACTSSNPFMHAITGIPRNDYLFDSKGISNLEKITKKKLKNKKIILFTPTFRVGYSKKQGSKNFNNIFGFTNFDNKSFNNFLIKNNIFFIFKLHPNEEPYLSNYKNLIDSENSFQLNNDLLTQYNIDFYEIINATDILVTDYSGIFIDFLLLNRPIIFTPVDLNDYAKTRNFLFTPYEHWTPGKKVLSQIQLMNEIRNILNGKDKYTYERKIQKDIWHYFQDNLSSKRVSKILLNYLNIN